MTELVFLLIKIGFLILLWVFVLSVAIAVRADLFGPRSGRGSGEGLTAREERAPRQRGRPTRAPRPAGRLVVVEGALAGMSIPLGANMVTIGRADDSTLVLTDDFASTRHARFVPNGDTWYVEDLGSTNGTYVDRAKVTGPTVVPLGQPVRIGKTVLELRP